MQTSTSTCRRLKAQSAFEFLFIFGIFLSALLIGMWVSASKTAEIRVGQKDLEINDVLTSVSDKINTAWLEGEGFSTNVTLPESVAGADYEINVTANYIILWTGDSHYLRTVITNNITGELTEGATNNIRNTGDGLVITLS